jgi:hypothetical protein
MEGEQPFDGVVIFSLRVCPAGRFALPVTAVGKFVVPNVMLKAPTTVPSVPSMTESTGTVVQDVAVVFIDISSWVTVMAAGTVQLQ